MGIIPRIFAALLREEIGAVRGRVAAEAAFGVLIALCVALALGFGIALGVTALAQAYGILVALTTATLTPLVLALIVWGLMVRARRRARRAMLLRRANQVRALRLALIETAPIIRNAPLLAFGVALFAGLAAGRGEAEEEEDEG